MTRTHTTTVAIAGGGPAGIMLGLLLARAGVDVTVLEKHGDFLRDFRGDTVHPSTLQLLDELGLAEEMERIPHRKVRSLAVGNTEAPVVRVDLDRLPGRYRYVAMTPQWDFLNMLVEHAERYPGFRILMNAEATDLIREGGAVRGLRYSDAEGEHELRAVLTVSADGRNSVLRRAAGLASREFGSPMDVLWLRVDRTPDAGSGLQARIGDGAMAVGIDRGDYWQIAFLIPKGGLEDIRSRPVTEFQDTLLEMLPYLDEKSVRAVDDWDEVAFLEVRMDRLERWYTPGYLCIGDAAHAMSPVGGVGINLAVQDAVATANLLCDALHRAQADPRRFERTLNPELLARVQRRRMFPTVGTQALQSVVQRRLIAQALSTTPEEPFDVPIALRALAASGALSWVGTRVLMLGLRPEHVRTPDRSPGAE
ncbi:2-polyprenyl-6-methoxyphenol hydroxylase-like FAD-dependent oxidoreductase [Nocardiopsis mwathae]|uniref:2-polyprenyl-6-methoxyphenol hydroxylase-like FAD-dependent oxidoreductase n=1 Tax=Nocardiopsis mwathae TaxID=1472723 RepID=A0A7X0D4E6_9ACTN|nr:FAD-dependent oxidoreductase [Nocardiopsis mwathae]MBB6169984.1 2-polyprenyl-6-methoxyphenol hydroxylase-like FAD-dependent oxidoreductase [Nocardiopsis mwathae]